MKITIPLLSALIAGASLIGNPTDPVGIVRSTIPAHDGGSATFAIVSLNLLNPVLTAGRVDSVTGTTFTVERTVIPENTYNTKNSENDALFYVEFTSGTLNGLTMPIVDHSNAVVGDETVTTIDLGETLAPELVAGDSFRIRAYKTIAQVFGADNSVLGLLGSNNIVDADSVYVNGPSGEIKRYYYRISAPRSGGTGWRSTTNSGESRSDAVIFGDSFVLGRIGPTVRPSIEIIDIGDVKVANQMIPVQPGTNFLAYPYPITVDLENLIEPSLLISTNNPNTSDSIFLSSPSGNFERYYYRTSAPRSGGTGWRNIFDASASQAGTTIEPGSALIFIRVGGAFNWDATRPFSL